MTRAAIFLAGCALCVMACDVAGSASCTLPAFRADTTGYSRVPNAAYCLPGSSALTDLAFVRVHISRQSPTWVEKRDSMLADPLVWDRYFPTVRNEAAIVMVSRTPISPTLAGTRYIFTPTNPWGASPLFYYVTTETARGAESCASNWGAIP